MKGETGYFPKCLQEIEGRSSFRSNTSSAENELTQLHGFWEALILFLKCWSLTLEKYK